MADRPKIGTVERVTGGLAGGTGVRLGGRTHDGTWRPDTPFLTTDGLKVTMRRAAGLTPRDVLRVPMRFQVPPIGEHRRSFRFNWSTFDTLSAGQRARPMGEQLLELQVDTLLLDRLAADSSSGVVVWDDAPDPERVLKELRHVQRRAAPFRLVVNQPAVWDDPVVSMVAVLTAVEPSQRPGEVGTEYLTVTFLQYPELRAGRQHRHEHPQRRHKLKSSDSLYELAKRYLHQASAWRLIAKANGISGVSPGSDSELWQWARKHHKTTLVIPRTELVGRVISNEAYLP